MKKDFSHETSPSESLFPLLEVFNEPLFRWIFHRKQRPHKQLLLSKIQTPWELIQHLSLLLESCIPYLEREYEEILPSVWVAKKVQIHGTATLLGPLVLGEGVEIGQEVYLQSPVYLGGRVRLERGAEVRSSILCEGVKVGASSIVLDSILGKGVVLEAQVTTLTRGEDTIPLSVEYPLGVFRLTRCHRLGSFICPGVRVRRGMRLKAGSFIPPGSLI